VISVLQQWDRPTPDNSRSDWLSAIARLNATKVEDDPFAVDDLLGEGDPYWFVT
jgi:hypothetical protein